jgi:asparagine synthase (glutamine-hydrolysing)
MCGIVGLFSFDGGPPPHREMWPQMVNHLRHRGPDEGAFWADGPFFFGSRRLSIIDVEHGQQPMATADGRLVVVSNGEIYNYVELRSELQAKGYGFRTQSDTEVLLHGYRAWGEDLPSRLKGMFAFAIADRRERSLLLARDRFGEKPLFYLHTSRYIGFASEPTSLAALPDLQRTMDIEALAGFLSLNYVPGVRSLLKGVMRLESGTWMRVGPTGTRWGRYWSPPAIAAHPHALSLAQAQDGLAERLDEAIRMCLRSDVPVGILLSGGIDSSLIAEAAVRQGNLSTAYFLDFGEPGFSEYAAARTVAHRLGLPLMRVALTPDALPDFLDLVRHADAPLGDSSAVAVWQLSRFAAKGSKVVLSGDGGDELFAGYQTYLATRLHARFVSRLPRMSRKALSWSGRRIRTSEGKASWSYKAWRFLRASDLPTEIAHFTWNGTWLPEQSATLVVPGPLRSQVSGALARLASQHDLNAGWSLLRYQIADITEYLPNDILTKSDRMSMAHGLEVRAPFLMHDLAEWALALPDNLKISPRGELKHLLRAMARTRFGSSIADRPKQGFSIPIHSWIRGPFADSIRDLLSPNSVRKLEVLDAAVIESLVDAHFSGRKSYGFELWGLAVLVAWHRLRIEQAPDAPRSEPLRQTTFPLH